MKSKQKHYYKNSRPEMLSFLPADMKVKRALDIGCGYGVFGKALKDLTGAEVWGVEVDKGAGLQAEKLLDKVLIMPVEEAIKNLPDNSFDVIYCNDVLEHLYDPERVVKMLRLKLKKNGLLISSIPNIRYFHTFIALVKVREWEYTHDGVLDFTHLRFFTDKSIVNMFQRAGYSVTKQEGINPTQIPKKYQLLNWFAKNRFSDSQYIQFATVAQKSS